MNAHQKLDDALQRLEDLEGRTEGLIASLADTKADWEIAFAEAFTASKGKTVDEKNNLAKLRCEKELRAYRTAEGAVEAAGKVGGYLRALVDGYRTQVASQRELTR